MWATPYALESGIPVPRASHYLINPEPRSTVLDDTLMGLSAFKALINPFYKIEAIVIALNLLPLDSFIPLPLWAL